MHIIHCIFGITTAIAALTACGGETSDEPRACRDGSCDHQSTNTFCDIDGVYPGTEAPNECIAPPAADACNRAVACDDAAKPYCDDDSMGTCVECTENLHCTVEGESCNPISGQCTTEVVVQCDPDDGGDATCAANSDVGDYCSDAGACADCLVDDHCSANVAEAICGQDVLECRGCEVGGDDCETGLCGTNEEGVCIQPSEVIYVNGGTGVDGGACDEGNPCKTIAAGIAEVGPGRDIILVAAGAYSGDGNSQIIVDGKSVSIVADGAVTLTENLLSLGHAMFDVQASSSLLLDGIEIAPNTANAGARGIKCLGDMANVTLKNVTIQNAGNGLVSDNCTLSIQDSEVSGNTGIGISATGGTLEVLRSKILSNKSGGIEADGASYSILNNFITYNGDSANTNAAVDLSGTAAEQIFNFNTLTGNQVSAGLTTGVTCALGALRTNTGNIIFGGLGGATPIQGNCNWEYSNIELPAEAVEDGPGNINESPLLVNDVVTDGDYHLADGSPCIDKVTDGTPPATDIDGDPRTAGSADMGADEFVAN